MTATPCSPRSARAVAARSDARTRLPAFERSPERTPRRGVSKAPRRPRRRRAPPPAPSAPSPRRRAKPRTPSPRPRPPPPSAARSRSPRRRARSRRPVWRATTRAPLSTLARAWANRTDPIAGGAGERVGQSNGSPIERVQYAYCTLERKESELGRRATTTGEGSPRATRERNFVRGAVSQSHRAAIRASSFATIGSWRSCSSNRKTSPRQRSNSACGTDAAAAAASSPPAAALSAAAAVARTTSRS